VVGGQHATGTIELESPVQAHTDVDLTSTRGVARFESQAAGWDAKPLNARVSIPEQRAWVSFRIETARVARQETVEIVAEWANGRASGKLRITPR
jgi:hypothetical protein